MDEIDRLLIKHASIHMKYFELGSFKKEFPSLYHVFRACIGEIRYNSYGKIKEEDSRKDS